LKKKILLSIMAIIAVLSTFINIGAQGNSRSWYIKRNGNSTPVFSKDTSLIENYGGIYIDKKAVANNDKVIYLTFDAGYENGNIAKILDTLKECEVPAAFFILDNIILKNPDIVKRMAEEGHLICNHTKNHRDLTTCNEEQIKKNITDLDKICEEKIGVPIAKYFRFPEGKYSENSLKVISEMGYTTVFWSFAYDDWDNARQPNKDKAMKKILDNTHCGAIILLHPTSSTNAEILPDLIKSWRAAGYKFGSLDQL